MEEERREHVMKMKKMEAEMEQVFEMKVKEKKQKLKDSEAEVSFWFMVQSYRNHVDRHSKPSDHRQKKKRPTSEDIETV